MLASVGDRRPVAGVGLGMRRPWSYARWLSALWLAAGAADARELHSYALVQDDASLVIDGERVRLYGIYLPDTPRYCQTLVNPARCASRAALALEFKVAGFVRCYPQSENRDGSLNAICYVKRTRFNDGEDLGAYLIEQGWALALPHAPFAYQALERIAKHHGRGVWGFSVDGFR